MIPAKFMCAWKGNQAGDEAWVSENKVGKLTFILHSRQNPALQDSPPAAGRFATDFIPAAVR